MMLLVVGWSFRNTPVELRERLAFNQVELTRALAELSARYGCEAVILSTCNRVEVYLARAEAALPLDQELITEFLGEFHGVPVPQLQSLVYHEKDARAVRHLFRVACSLDSLIVGEAQITGQVKRAYELAQQLGCAGPLLHGLFQHAFKVAGRVRSETGISKGHVSVSSAAVDYVRQVFDHFRDKTVLVIGAGKMGELTLRHLRRLRPGRILVTNRSPEKALAVACGCGGTALPWDKLDDALAQADIILSTTGAAEPVVSLPRYRQARARNPAGSVVILDIAVPRDFDPHIHDGERTCLFNIDDLKRIRQQTLRDRRGHLDAAEAVVAEEERKFLADLSRRRHGPVIARLTEDLEAKRRAVVQQLMGKLNGKLTDADRAQIEGAFRLFQNQVLHGPIKALGEEAHQGAGSHTLLEALRKLFRLQE